MNIESTNLVRPELPYILFVLSRSGANDFGPTHFGDLDSERPNGGTSPVYEDGLSFFELHIIQSLESRQACKLDACGLNWSDVGGSFDDVGFRDPNVLGESTLLRCLLEAYR